jgi:uncharacterized protein GlcG (DUF336 family)
MRQNAHGEPCPPWCATDHSERWNNACVSRAHGAGNAWACAVRDHEGSHVCVMGIEDGPSVSLNLSPEDAATMAALAAMAGAAELSAAIRQALIAIEEAGQ